MIKKIIIIILILIAIGATIFLGLYIKDNLMVMDNLEYSPDIVNIEEPGNKEQETISTQSEIQESQESNILTITNDLIEEAMDYDLKNLYKKYEKTGDTYRLQQFLDNGIFEELCKPTNWNLDLKPEEFVPGVSTVKLYVTKDFIKKYKKKQDVGILYPDIIKDYISIVNYRPYDYDTLYVVYTLPDNQSYYAIYKIDFSYEEDTFTGKSKEYLINDITLLGNSYNSKFNVMYPSSYDILNYLIQIYKPELNIEDAQFGKTPEVYINNTYDTILINSNFNKENIENIDVWDDERNKYYGENFTNIKFDILEEDGLHSYFYKVYYTTGENNCIETLNPVFVKKE